MEPMSTLVDRLAARLQEKGIDPANFAGNVPRAVETLTTDRAEAGSLPGRIYGYYVRFHALQPVQIDVELGEEHERVLSDLIGQEPTRRSVSARVCARQPT